MSKASLARPFVPRTRRLYWWALRELPSAATRLRVLPRLVRVAQNRILRRSDYARWKGTDNLELWWESRTAQLATLIPPGSRVVEFGAGRGYLARHLTQPAAYFPSDIVSRGESTLVYDLNQRPLPDIGHLRADVAVFSGVMEYLLDLPEVIEWLSTQAPMCVVSYDVLRTSRWTPARVGEVVSRRRFGYMNDLEVDELKRLFERAGYACVRSERWETQRLFVFRRDRQAGSAQSLRP